MQIFKERFEEISGRGTSITPPPYLNMPDMMSLAHWPGFMLWKVCAVESSCLFHARRFSQQLLPLNN